MEYNYVKYGGGCTGMGEPENYSFLRLLILHEFSPHPHNDAINNTHSYVDADAAGAYG